MEDPHNDPTRKQATCRLRQLPGAQLPSPPRARRVERVIRMDGAARFLTDRGVQRDTLFA
jgi:hypothetical protein